MCGKISQCLTLYYRVIDKYSEVSVIEVQAKYLAVHNSLIHRGFRGSKCRDQVITFTWRVFLLTQVWLLNILQKMTYTIFQKTSPYECNICIYYAYSGHHFIFTGIIFLPGMRNLIFHFHILNIFQLSTVVILLQVKTFFHFWLFV